jgi:hypothetical protein
MTPFAVLAGFFAVEKSGTRWGFRFMADLPGSGRPLAFARSADRRYY